MPVADAVDGQSDAPHQDRDCEQRDAAGGDRTRSNTVECGVLTHALDELWRRVYRAPGSRSRERITIELQVRS
jgi:hypothetical protein